MEKQIIKLNDPDWSDQLEKAYRDMAENEGLQLKRLGKDIKRIFTELYNDTFQAKDLEALNTQKLRCLQLRRRMKTIVRIKNGSHLGFHLKPGEAQKLIDEYLEELKESEELIVQKIKMLEIESKTIQPEASKEKLFNEKRAEFKEAGFFELKKVKDCKDPDKLLAKILEFKAKTLQQKSAYQVAFLDFLGLYVHLNKRFENERNQSTRVHKYVKELLGLKDWYLAKSQYNSLTGNYKNFKSHEFVEVVSRDYDNDL